MLDVDTILTSSLFGISTDTVSGAWPSILVGAIAVGVIQPFSRILFTYIFKTKVVEPIKKRTRKAKPKTKKRGTKMAYKKKKTAKKKDDKKKKKAYGKKRK
jgi:hypothetical protein